MTDMNGFVNLTQLRKMTQETLKPIITEIEQQISKMKKQSQFLKQQSQKSQIIFQHHKKFEEFMSTTQEQMRDTKIRLEELKDQDLKQMLQTKKQISALNQQVNALKRERVKYENMINGQKKENDRILEGFGKYQNWMDEKVVTMNEEFLKLKKQTLEMTAYVKSDYEMTACKFKQLQKEIQNKLLANDKKYQILQLYLRQREQTRLKLIQLQSRFSQYATVDKIQYLRTCQLKQLEMNKTQINAILETYLPPKIKQMLPQIQQRVKQIDKITSEIVVIKTNVFESEQQMENFKQTTQSLQSNVRKQFKEINNTISSNIEVLKADVKVALAIDQKQTQQRKQFQQLFTNRIQTFVKQENEQTIKRMQQQTFTKLQQRKKHDQSKLKQQQLAIEKKCEEMKEISDNIEKLLAGYNSRIVKIRSDTQLFRNQVLKDMKTIMALKEENREKFEDVGKVLASLVQVMMTNLTIDINLSPQSLRKDNFAFATFNDGLIYQVVPLYSKQGQLNNLNQIKYRRNDLQIPHLKRSILLSMVNLIDRIYQSYPYLSWSNYKPSNFFKEEILQNYFIQVEKYGGQNQEEGQMRNTMNQGSYDVLRKKENTTSFFRKSNKAYSPPKKQTMTITFDPSQFPQGQDTIVNTLNPFGETIDENIELHVTRGQSSFLLTENDKLNIKRGMRTIHEVHPRDSSNNRIITSGFGGASYSKETNTKTIDRTLHSAGGNRKRYLSKRQIGRQRYKNNMNDTETFMTSRSSKRTASIGHYKF